VSRAVPLGKARLPPSMEWQIRGLCRSNPGLFDDPPQYVDKEDLARLAQAALVCADCPVRAECLDFGIATRGWGVHAGVLLRGGTVIPFEQIGRRGRPPKTAA
jgi:Transcription factor WhiB